MEARQRLATSHYAERHRRKRRGVRGACLEGGATVAVARACQCCSRSCSRLYVLRCVKLIVRKKTTRSLLYRKHCDILI